MKTIEEMREEHMQLINEAHLKAWYCCYEYDLVNKQATCEPKCTCEGKCGYC